MPYVARRTIAELSVLYDLEPEIRDVFVEGSDDVAVLKWYLRHRSNCAFSVLEIGAIDIPSSVIEAHNLDRGNRDCVLALAAELSGQLKGHSRNCPTLVYDADLDRLFESHRSVEMLIPTDFACLEMYLFNEATVDKMMSLVLRGCEVSVDQALNTLTSVLVRLWIIKAANHMLGLSMSWISFNRCCEISGASIVFDENEFINRYLTNSSRSAERGRFTTQMGKIESNLQDDPRHQIDGHHFFILARWYFRHFARDKSVLRGEDAFGRAFFGCLELEALDQQPLFQQLLARIAA